MHTPGRHYLIWILGLALAAGAAGAIYFWRQHDADQPAYQQARVARGDLQVFVLTTGTVQPQNRLEIKSPIAGRVEQALVAEGDKIQKGKILAWMSSTERAAMLDAAHSKGATTLAYWEELYKPTPLMAPLDGTIIARKIEPGQTVTASDILYVMSDRLIIVAQVDETDIGSIAVGQAVELTLDAYPENSITGRVDQIAHEAKIVNNVTTYTVEVLPLTIPAFLRSGMSANLKILTAAASGVLLLPAEAVHTEKNRTVVWRPAPSSRDGHTSAPVTTGLSDGKQTEICAGLQEGDTVLLKASPFSAKENQRQVNPFLPSPRRR